MAKKRPNVVPIIEDARRPEKYRMLVPMVDVIFADVAQVKRLPRAPLHSRRPPVRHCSYFTLFSAKLLDSLSAFAVAGL